MHNQLSGRDPVLVKSLLQELRGELGVVGREDFGADDVAAVDVDDDIGVVEGTRVPAGAQVGDVPRPDRIGLGRAVRRRLGTHLRRACRRAPAQQASLAKDAVQARQRAPVLLLFVKQLVEGLRQAQVDDVGTAESLYDLVSHRIGDTQRAGEVLPKEAPVPVGSVPPIAVRASSQSQSLTGFWNWDVGAEFRISIKKARITRPAPLI